MSSIHKQLIDSDSCMANIRNNNSLLEFLVFIGRYVDVTNTGHDEIISDGDKCLIILFSVHATYFSLSTIDLMITGWINLLSDSRILTLVWPSRIKACSSYASGLFLISHPCKIFAIEQCNTMRGPNLLERASTSIIIL